MIEIEQQVLRCAQDDRAGGGISGEQQVLRFAPHRAKTGPVGDPGYAQDDRVFLNKSRSFETFGNAVCVLNRQLYATFCFSSSAKNSPTSSWSHRPERASSRMVTADCSWVSAGL